MRRRVNSFFNRPGGHDQAFVCFIDVVNGGLDPSSMVVGRRHSVRHVVVRFKNDTPHLAAELVSGDGSWRSTAKPSGTRRENARES